MKNELDLSLSPEYTRVRKLAQKVSAQMPPEHFCRKGNGACCEIRDLALTEGDERVIFCGIKEGGISEKTIQKASQNVADKTNPYCAFFDRTKRTCTIYPYRPIQCIAYGMSAIPLQTGEYKEVFLEREEAGVDRGLSLRSCDRIKMCESCCLTNTYMGVRIPLGVLEDSQEVTAYFMKQDDISMPEFVDNLPEVLSQLRESNL